MAAFVIIEIGATVRRRSYQDMLPINGSDAVQEVPPCFEAMCHTHPLIWGCRGLSNIKKTKTNKENGTVNVFLQKFLSISAYLRNSMT